MKLKELRQKRGINQEELAKVVNTTQRTISNYEKNNGTEPTLEMLCKLADYFNVSLDYLCERKWNDNIGYVPQDKKELVSLVLSLDDEQAKDITQMVKGYLFARNKISTGIFDNEGA